MALMFFEGWWDPLGETEKIFWGISIVFSILFLILLVVSRIGLHFKSDKIKKGQVSSNKRTTGFTRILTVRSIIAFFTFFGWAGLLLHRRGVSIFLVLILAAFTGFIVMFLVQYLSFLFSKQFGTTRFEMAKALYKTGKVYRSIPANKNGPGRVQIKLSGILKEVDAMTRGDALPSGATIKVVEIIDNDLIIVEPVLPVLQ